MLQKLILLFALIASTQSIQTKELVDTPAPTQTSGSKQQIGIINIQGAIEPSSYKYLSQIRSAVDNKEMCGVIVVINSGGGGCGIGEAIRMELARLCKHKPVFVVATNRCGSMGYIIASVADKIFAAPSSTMGHIGVLCEIKKYINEHPLGRNKNKIEHEFLYVGEHTIIDKPETKGITSEERTFIQNEISNLYNHYCNQIAQSRGISMDDQHIWANGFTHSGLQAKRIGLIDELGTFNDALNMMKTTIEDKANGKCTFDLVDLSTKDKKENKPSDESNKRLLFAAYHYAKGFFKKSSTEEKPKVGIINIHSEIDADSDKHLQQMRSILKDDNFKGLIVTINSGGGNFGIGESLYLELKQIKQKMPVVVWIVDICNEISYLIASVGDKIIGTYGGEVGGIGIWHQISKYYETPKDDNKNEVNIEYIFAGEHKVSEFPVSPKITTEERKHLQDGLEELYDHYCSVIADARGLSLDNKSEWANGFLFGGGAAKELNLIDEIGSLSDAEDCMKQLLNKDGKPISEINMVEVKES
ncbi:MAG TPA: S49 family peptidase [Candidatus Babeliales bacterium]|nr:S49 family peptidase [Candidatus Babeliales bacterium]